MNRTRLFFVVLGTALFLFAGCSSKEYYKPKKVENSWPVCREHDDIARRIIGERPTKMDLQQWPPCRHEKHSLVETGAEGAVAEGGAVIERSGPSGRRFSNQERFLGVSDGYLLTTTIDGNITLYGDANRTRRLSLEKTVAAAALAGDTAAVVFADNTLALYNIDTGKSFYKESGQEPIAVDHRIPSPYFLGKLVVFPSLDGKVVVIDSESREVLRSTIVSTEKFFNNIFYFNVIGDTMVAATPYTLYCLSDKERRAKLELRAVDFTRDGIWAATKEGEVILYDTKLHPKQRRKFPFAHFLGMIVDDEKVYLLEKEGFLIVLDKSFNTQKVYDVALEDGLTYTTDNAFYNGDLVITVR